MHPFDERPEPRLAFAWTSSSLLQLGGSLSVLPLELVFDILDELFLGTGHAGLCALRNLSLTSKSSFQTVYAYLQRQTPSEYLRSVQWQPYPHSMFDEDDLGFEIFAIESSTAIDSDIITSTIAEDCPQCFDWLCRRIPNLYWECCNRNGWSFPAIAAHAGSTRLLKHFLAQCKDEWDYYFPLLCCEANPYDGFSHMPLRVIANRRDVAHFERCLDVLGPALFETNRLYHIYQRRIGRLIFEPADLLTICTFATPSLAERLAAIGAPLYNIHGDSSSWHAAAHNGPEMLSYIKEHTADRPTARGWYGNTPLQVAVRANEVDSVLWFSMYDGARDFHWDPNYLDALETACEITSKESVLSLEILIPGYPHVKYPPPVMTSQLLHTLVLVARDAAQTNAVRSDIDQTAYEKIRGELEERAIRKAKLIQRYSTPMRRISREGARRLASFWGFERLARVLLGVPEETNHRPLPNLDDQTSGLFVPF